MSKTYTVTSPVVVLRNPEQGGRQEYVYQGSVLPSFVTGDDVTRLLDEGHIAEVGATLVTPISTPDQADPITGVPTPVGQAGTAPVSTAAERTSKPRSTTSGS